MFTWYSVTRPSAQRTCCSLIHAPRTFRSVLADRVSPCWIASSKLFADVALISVTLATDIHDLLYPRRLDEEERLESLQHRPRQLSQQNESFAGGWLSPTEHSDHAGLHLPPTRA